MGFLGETRNEHKKVSWVFHCAKQEKSNPRYRYPINTEGLTGILNRNFDIGSKTFAGLAVELIVTANNLYPAQDVGKAYTALV